MSARKLASLAIVAVLTAATATGVEAGSRRTGDPPNHVLRAASIVSSSYFGGGNDDTITAVAVASNGDVVAVGTTASSTSQGFPAAGGYDSTFNPAGFCATGQPYYDAFVARFKADGSGLVFATYLGGTCNQVATSVALDPAGNIYVGGFTTSPVPSFPVTVGPMVTQPGGLMPGDGFVARLSADGTQLGYCGYVGGTGSDAVYAIAVDSSGHAYVGGSTTSRQGLPVTVGPMLTAPDSDELDGFVAKVKPDGSGFDYCGYVGGAGLDEITAVALDTTGALVVGGQTTSVEGLPVSGGPDQTHNGIVDAFVGKVRPDGTGFAWLGYVGGASNDSIGGLAATSDGGVVIAGMTNSDESTFPVLTGPDLTFNTTVGKLNSDGYVAKVRSDGSALEYCGYLGGDLVDSALDVAVDASGVVVVAGITASTETSFPVVGAFDSSSNGPLGVDTFVAAVSATGSTLLFSSFLGGSANDPAACIALDANGRAVVAGGTISTDFPTAGAFGPTKAGFHDAFVTTVDLGLGPPPPSVASAVKQGKKLVVTGANFDSGAKVLVNGAEYKTKRDGTDPTGKLKSGKAGKIIVNGDRVRVRNGDGRESNEVVFAG